MPVSRLALAAVVGALTLLATACSGGSLDVELRADADGPERVEVSYTVDGETVTEAVDVPWTHALTVSDRFAIELSVTNPEDRGRVRCMVSMGRGSPVIEAEQEAICRVSGTASGDELIFSSSTERVDRDGPAVLDDDGEVSLDVVLLGLDGERLQPELFDRIDVALHFDGVREPVAVSYDVELVGPERTRSAEGFRTYDEDDIVDGGILAVVLDDGYRVDRYGTYRVRVEGSVRTTESDAIDLPFDEELTFVVEEPPADEARGVEELTLLDGYLTLDLPGSWSVISEADGLEPYGERPGTGRVDLVGSDIQALAALATGSSGVDFTVFRATRPLLVGDIDDVTAQLVGIYEESELLEPVTSEVAEVFGVDGRAIAARTNDFEIDTRVGRVGDEFIVVQIRNDRRDIGFEEAVAIVESMRIDPGAVPPLLHFVRHDVSIIGDGEAPVLELSMAAPADWERQDLDDPDALITLFSPDGLRAATIETSSEEPTGLDELVEAVVGENRTVIGEIVDDERGDLDGYPIALVETGGADGGIGPGVLMIGTDGSSQFVAAAFDSSGARDIDLVRAIVRSVRLSDPFEG